MKTKKLNKFKALSAVLLAAAAVTAVVAPVKLTASANSGPTHWHGVTASGTVFSGEDCPIEAESEVLTFDIREFIRHGSEKEELLNYNASFSAEYAFKNPKKNAVNVTLAFPLGQRCDIGFWEEGTGNYNTDNYIYLEDLLAKRGAYEVLVDGEKIEAETRYTFHELNDFDFSEESKRIYDGYREHKFFSLDLPVFRYTFDIVSGEEEHFEAEATIKNTQNLRFGGSYGATKKTGATTVLGYSVKNGSEIELYSVGGELDTDAIEWEFFKTSGYFNLIYTPVKALAVCSPKFEETTFETYVFAGYSWGNGVSLNEKSDFYNAALDYIDCYLGSSMLPKSFAFLKNSSYMMRWLKYDLNFAAGQTVKNTVKAPLYSGGYYNYTPYVYTYNYLLSPAQNWNGFKSLEIRINTPYYLINSNLQFKKTDFGYVYKDNGLPDGELEFELCEVENPEHKVNHGYTVLAVIFILLGLLCLMVPVAIIIIIIVVVVIHSKKGNRNADKGGKNGFKPMNTFDGKK